MGLKMKVRKVVKREISERYKKAKKKHRTTIGTFKISDTDKRKPKKQYEY